MILSDKDISRFWAKVKVGSPSDCWPWLAATTDFGHGVFSIKHKWINAHRVAFFIANGCLPTQGRMVMHSCENSRCQNPNHLVDGTNKENQNYPKCLTKHKSRTSPMLGRTGKHSPRYGTKHSEQTKAKLRKAALEREQRKRDSIQDPES